MKTQRHLTQGTPASEHLQAPETPGPKQPEERSLEFERTGAEIPTTVYKTIVFAYAWIVVMAWIDFGRSTESTWLASIGAILGVVFFGIPIVLRHTNHALAHRRKRHLDAFLESDVEIATGRLQGREAYLQIMIIPLCLAVAATLLGLVWVWEG